MLKISAALIILATVTACGGGSNSASSGAPQDNTAAIAQQAIKNISDSTPAPKPAFEGAWTAINGVSNGYVFGPSAEAIARGLAQTVVNEPVKWADYYRLLLSSAGLHITILGDSTGVNQFGMATHAPDTIYTVKLTSDGTLLVTS